MGWVGSGWVGLDDGNSDNRANSVQLELGLGLSLAINCLKADTIRIGIFYIMLYFNILGEKCWSLKMLEK